MKFKKHLFTTAFALAAASAASAAQAATISAFTFATNLSPTTQATNTTTTAIAATGFIPVISTDITSGRSASFTGSYYTRSAAGKIGSSYIEFTLKPTTGYAINLTGFTFDFASTARFNSGTSSFELQYSLNGGAFTAATATAVTGAYPSSPASPVITISNRNSITTIDRTATYDLSSLGSVGATSGIVFRIYASGSAAKDQTMIQRYDNFNVTGAVVVVP